MSYGAIYQIVNTVNGKRYIGQSTEPAKRIAWHKSQLKYNCHYNQHLQNAYNKHKLKSFFFNIIEYVDSSNELNLKEIGYIKKYKATNPKFGYNFKDGGSSGKHNIETQKKIRFTKAGVSFFNFCSALYTNRNNKPWTKVWQARIMINGKHTSLGYFNDPLTCDIVYKIVRAEI